MACSLSITTVTGIPATPGGTTTSSIHVTGTVSECQPINLASGSFDVVVQVDCGGGAVSTATRSSGGAWAVDVPATCSCTKPIIVVASCATNPNCADTFTGVLDCQQAACPAGALTVNVGTCNADGTRAVTLTANLASIPSGTVFGQWDFGDATFGGPAFPITAPGSITPGPHGYTPPGPYTAQLLFVLPAGCPPLTATVSGLQPCPIDCPTIAGNLTVSVAGVCNANGTRTAHLGATISGGTMQAYRWEFGDTSAPLTFSSPFPPSAPAIDHDYPAPGTGTSTYTATLTVTGHDPSCIDTAVVAVNVPGCGGACPSISNVTAQVGDCKPGNIRPVSLDANVSGGGVTEFDWDFGDGMSQVITLNPSPATSHDYATPGTYTATVTMKGPPGCPDQTASGPVNVPSCRGDDNGNGGFNFCAGLLVAAITLFLIGGILIIIGVCSGVLPVLIAGIAAAILGLVLFALWVLFCAAFTPCSVMQKVHCVLFVMIAIVGPIIALLAFLLGGLACGLAAAGAWGGWGTLYAWLGAVMGAVGCTKTC
jgi:hypothetical protein